MEEKQEKEQKTEFKGNFGFIWLIGILVILLGCVTVYTLKITADNKELKQTPVISSTQQAVESKDTKASTEEKYANMYNIIKGTYGYKGKESNSNYDFTCDLTLKEDGTFYYYVIEEGMIGFCGNYIIVEDHIILNKLFNIGTDGSLNLTKGQVQLKINSDKTISDFSNYEGLNSSEIILKQKQEEDTSLYSILNETINESLYPAKK